MTVSDIVEIMETIAPLELSRNYIDKYGGYDNSGLLVGSLADKAERVMLCLDCGDDEVAAAIAGGYNMIICHHPFIYSPLSSIIKECGGSAIMAAIKNSINIYSAHLNLDAAEGGVNDSLCEVLGISPTCSLLEFSGGGMGRLGTTADITLEQLKKRVQTQLCDSTVWASGNQAQIVKTVAVLGGGGGGDATFIDRACALGADVLISSEFKHHIILMAKQKGLALISASHYCAEIVALEILRQKIAAHGIDVGVVLGENPYI